MISQSHNAHNHFQYCVAHILPPAHVSHVLPSHTSNSDDSSRRLTPSTYGWSRPASHIIVFLPAQSPCTRSFETTLIRGQSRTSHDDICATIPRQRQNVSPLAQPPIGPARTKTNPPNGLLLLCWHISYIFRRCRKRVKL